MGIRPARGNTTDVEDANLPRRPVLTFWLVALELEVVLGGAFLVSGAESSIDAGLSKAGIDFGSDLVTALHVVVVYPAALLGVTLARSLRSQHRTSPYWSSRASEVVVACFARSAGGSVRGPRRSGLARDSGSGWSWWSSSRPATW